MNNLESGDSSKKTVQDKHPQSKNEELSGKVEEGVFSHGCLTQNVYFGGRWKHS